MAVTKINIETFLSWSGSYPVIDVRSPAEYDHAHFPEAQSIPLFNDEERRIVGTIYKQQSREEAIKKGLEFFGPKMKQIVEEAESILNRKYAISNKQRVESEKKLPIANCLLLYCWRGGMRSAAIAWLLDIYGYKVYTLAGGYKSFRRYVLNIFKQEFNINILGGYTGSGKTELLRSLKEKGETVIDLEALAGHKGSAFGNIGLPKQPSQEMFENRLALELYNTNVSRETSEVLSRESSDEKIHSALALHASRFTPQVSRLWLEDESQRIGLVNIPPDLWKTMRRSPVWFVDIPFEERLKHIIREYGSLDKQQLIDAIGRIREKLGGQHAKEAVNLLDAGNTIESFRILLKYYDKFYAKSLHNRENADSLLHIVNCKEVTVENANTLSKISHPHASPV